MGISTSCVSSYALVRPPQEGFPCDTLQDRRDWKPANRNSKGERWKKLDTAEYPFTRKIAERLPGHDDRKEYLAEIDLILGGILK